MIINFTYLTRVFLIATRRFFIEKYTFRVSALAFTTLLALVPLFSISVFFVTIFPVFTNVVSISEKYIFKNFVPVAADAIQVHFGNFIQQATHLPVISIILLIFTAILTMNTIDETINDIWNISKRRRKIFVWLFYAVILSIAPILLGASVFLTSYIFSFSLFTKITSILFFIFPLIINTIIFSLFYLFVPNTYVRKRDGIFGGFLAALLIEVARIIFAVYISYFSNYELIYGVFSTLPIILIWLYICWFIILWGAVFTHTLSIKKG